MSKFYPNKKGIDQDYCNDKIGKLLGFDQFGQTG